MSAVPGPTGFSDLPAGLPVEGPSPRPVPSVAPVPGPGRPRRAHSKSRRPVVPAPDPSPSRLAHLVVVPDVEGPRVRLGMAWAFVTFTAAAAGPLWIGLWMAAVAFIAGAQTARTWRNRARRPHPGVAAGAALLPLAAAFGAWAALAALVALAAASFAAGPARAALGRSTRGRISGPLTAMITLSIGAAAAAPVLARHLGLVEVVVLLALVGVYDASNYLIGSGASNQWEGPVAGMAFMAAVTLAVAAIFVPPFRGLSPWLLGLLAVVLTPAGPLAGSGLLGGAETRLPALRRLDSLLLTGPVWVGVAALVSG